MKLFLGIPLKCHIEVFGPPQRKPTTWRTVRLLEVLEVVAISPNTNNCLTVLPQNSYFFKEVLKLCLILGFNVRERLLLRPFQIVLQLL